MVAEDEESEEGEAAEGKGAAKGKKDKGKATEAKKECPAPTAGTGTTTPAAGTASLAEGQKIYNANCQGCHGALPGEKQGASAADILGASTVGAHKGVTPWPIAQASALSAQDAAASLAAAMK
jgi:mono/diheme cytochrome c family protein